jgi:hypothetical protein
MLIEEGRCFVVDYPSDFEASLTALRNERGYRVFARVCTENLIAID